MGGDRSARGGCRMRPHPWLLALGLAVAACGGSIKACGAPESRPLRGRAPEPHEAAAPMRILIERVVQNCSLTLEFSGGAPAQQGGQSVYLYLAAIARDRNQASGIAGLAKGATATTDTGQTVALRGYSRNDEEAPDGRSWRAYLLAQDVDLKARQLRDVRGALLVYPSARCV